MARSGLYKSDVKRARDALIADRQYPSLDAVRIALGNTGSRTTIHKYLKELEAEEGVAAKGISLSEELQEMVTRLAERLREEADSKVAAIQAECDAKVLRLADIRQDLERALTAAHARGQQLEQQLAEAQRQTKMVEERLQQESIARHTAEQRVADLTERLTENESHRQSLEEKHNHARAALDHFRQATKEQRDQDQRRHEHQLQEVQAALRQAQQLLAGKQEELTRVNQEGARLVGDLLHTRSLLAESKKTGGRREAELSEQLKTMRTQAGTTIEQLSDLRLESAAQAREIQLLQQELGRLRGLHDQLTEEKVTWRHERAQMEEMLRQKEQE